MKKALAILILALFAVNTTQIAFAPAYADDMDSPAPTHKTHKKKKSKKKSKKSSKKSKKKSKKKSHKKAKKAAPAENSDAAMAVPSSQQ